MDKRQLPAAGETEGSAEQSASGTPQETQEQTRRGATGSGQTPQETQEQTRRGATGSGQQSASGIVHPEIPRQGTENPALPHAVAGSSTAPSNLPSTSGLTDSRSAQGNLQSSAERHVPVTFAEDYVTPEIGGIFKRIPSRYASNGSAGGGSRSADIASGSAGGGSQFSGGGDESAFTVRVNVGRNIPVFPDSAAQHSNEPFPSSSRSYSSEEERYHSLDDATRGSRRTGGLQPEVSDEERSAVSANDPPVIMPYQKISIDTSDPSSSEQELSAICPRETAELDPCAGTSGLVGRSTSEKSPEQTTPALSDLSSLSSPSEEEKLSSPDLDEPSPQKKRRQN